MSARKPANAWMRRHLRDPYVRKANAEGYRSRAAYKLLELDARDHLLRPGMRVLDLGAAPGGWSQVAAARVKPAGRVVAVDLLPVAPIADVTLLQGDVGRSDIRAAIDAAFEGRPIDLVMSDMAPNLTGVPAVDEARSQELVRVAVEAAQQVLKQQGRLLVKAFHGAGLDAVILQIRARFADVVIRKPQSSRSQSSEVYVIASRILKQ